MSSTMYRVFSHLDNPRRILSLTIDELVVALIGVMLLVASNHKLLVGVFTFLLFSVLRRFKKGNGPRALLVQIYWYLPNPISQWLVTSLPASYLRVWRC